MGSVDNEPYDYGNQNTNAVDRIVDQQSVANRIPIARPDPPMAAEVLRYAQIANWRNSGSPAPALTVVANTRLTGGSIQLEMHVHKEGHHNHGHNASN